jgi:hypothetical protein
MVWETLDSIEAEAKARQFLKQKHSIVWIFFRMIYKEENIWILHGELKLKRAYFFPTTRSFKIKVNADTGEVVSYEETEVPQSKDVE